MTTDTPTPVPAPPKPAVATRKTVVRAQQRTPFHAHGEPKLWLTGGALTVCAFMIVGLLVLIVLQGVQTFWPSPVVQVTTFDGHSYMGEVTRTETYQPTQENLDALTDEARDRAK